MPGEVNVGRVHRNLAATLEHHGSVEVAGREGWQAEVAKGGPGFGDSEAGPGGQKPAGLQGTADRRGQQRRWHAIRQRALRKQDLRVTREGVAFDLQDLELTRSQVEGEPRAHW